MGKELTLPAAVRCEAQGKFRMHKPIELLLNPRNDCRAKAADMLEPKGK